MPDHNHFPDIDVAGNGVSITDGDITPSTTDNTDFGNQVVCTGTLVKTFTLGNTGTDNVVVTGITVSGNQATEFTVGGITFPQTIAPGGSVAFNVTFNPNALGLRFTTLNVASNDCDENPYDFTIQGTGIDPEINLQGNNVSIVDGDLSPSTADFTDFGNVLTMGGNLVRTFTIQNTGSAPLNVTNINMSGANAGDFAVSGISLPASVAASGSTTFTVTFDPSASTVRTATVNITNDDCNESNYDFAVQGTGKDVGAALDFDNIDDYVTIGTLLAAGSSYTKEAWVNTSINGGNILGSAGNPFWVAGGQLTAGNNSSIYLLQDPTALPLNTWVHVAVTYDAPTSTMRLYRNGVQVAMTNSAPTYNGGAMAIGAYYPGYTTSLWKGKIDEVRVWNVARNCEEIRQLYNCELTGSESGLIGYYQFNQGVDGGNNTGVTTLTDLAGGDNNGTLTNFALTGSTSNWVAPGGVATGTSCATFVFAEADVQGNGVSIADGDQTPSLSDHTIFGSIAVTGGIIDWTYTLQNTGTAALTVGAITFSGANAADFSVQAAPPASVAPGASATFVIRFNPSAPGIRNAVLNLVLPNECDETPYDFSIQGTGIEPEMDVKGNNVSIVDGDATPALTDHTDFGVSNVIGGTIDRTFTIENTNLADLNLTGTPIVAISGAQAADFTVVTQPTTPVAPSTGTTTFTVRFDPSAVGLRSAMLSINNDDANENPYNFSIQGTGALSEIAVSGKAQNIADGDVTPSTTDDTDFGEAGIGGGFVAHTFTISNSGNAALMLSGTPNVVISGPGAAHFSVTAQPVSPLAAITGTTTFTVKFQPNLPGLQLATISIDNDDADENPFNFNVSGLGTDPEMTLTGNGIEIADGDNTPSLADHTDFGSADINGSTVDRTYTISSSGLLDLHLDGTPIIQISGANADEFSVITLPNTTIPTGNSTTFTIRFSPSAAGLRSAVVTIPNDDATEMPYDFVVQGTGTGVAPDINVKGNGASIADGDVTPSTADHTDFGSTPVGGTPVTRIFTIENLGTAALNLTGTPLVAVSGPQAADFVVTVLPAGTVGTGSSTTFSVQFTPTASGLRSATLMIGSNDFYETPYNFSIQGVGLDQEIDLQGGSPLASIADGTMVPSTVNGTDFGAQCVSVGTVTHIFTILNTGGSDLALTGMPSVSISGANAADFSVGLQPGTPIAGHSSTTFTVIFNPSGSGLRTASLSIGNDDPDENPYDFIIQGTGLDINAVLSGNATICSGASTNLSALITGSGTAPYAVVYSDGTSNFTANNYQSGDPIPVSPAGNKAYTLVSVTDAGSCAATVVSGSASVTINPIPDVTDPLDQTLCNGATGAVSFSGSVSGTVFNWTNNNPAIGLGASGSGSIAAFTAINNGTAPVVAQLTVTPQYTFNAVTCTGPSQNFTLTVQPTPEVADPSDQTLCNGATTTAVTFTGTVSGTTYSWINNTPSIGLTSSGTGDIPAFAAVNNGSAPVTATITVTPSTNGCPGPVQSFTITVNPTPNVVDPPDQTLCNGDQTTAVTFTGATSGTIFTWTNNMPSIGLVTSGSGSIASFTAQNNGSAPVTATITVTPSANGCTGIAQTFHLTVNPTPEVADPVDQTLCNGANTETVTFSGSVAGTVYTWTNDLPGIGLAASGSGDIASFAAVNNGTTPVTATITVTPTADGCVGVDQTFTITVNPTPTVVDPADQTLCNGANTTAIIFTGSSGSATYDWVNNTPSIGLAASGTGGIASFTAMNNGTAPVTATITVTPSENGCPGPAQTFTIRVNPTPTVVDPMDQTLCNGAATAAINFSGAVSGTTYNWVNNTPSIGLIASGTSDIGPFTALNNGTAPVTATITVTPTANGCPGPTQNFTVTVQPTPHVVDPLDQVLCNGTITTAVMFSGAVSGTTYSWTNSKPSIGLPAAGSGDIGAFTATNTNFSPVTAIITVTPSANGCAGPSQTFSITVNPTPSVDFVPDQQWCDGALTTPTNLSGPVGATTFDWMNSQPGIGLAAAGTGNLPSYVAVNSGILPVTATITVTPTANSCPGADLSFNIRINPTPNVVHPADQTVCNGEQTTIVNFVGAVNGTTYAWANNTTSLGLPANGLGNIAAFTAINNGTTPITATITVIPTANGCSGSSQSFTITVNPTPNVVDPMDQALCNGAVTSAVAFTGSVSGTTFDWVNDMPSIGLAASGSGDISAFTAINNGVTPIVATITVTPTANGCTGPAQTFTIVVHPTPGISAPVADQTVCNGALTSDIGFFSNVLGTTYIWTNDMPGIGLPAMGSGDIAAFTAINNGSNPITAIITATPTSNNGCVGPPLTVSITVNPTPSVVVPIDQTVCNGGNTAAVNFTGNVSGSTFNWINDTPSIGLAASGSGNIASFSAVNTGAVPVVATITITPIANGCVGGAQTFTITVNPTTDVVDPLDQTLCNGATTTAVIFSGTVSGTTYAWTNDNTTIGLGASGNGDIMAFTALNGGSVAATATITVTPTANGCPGPVQTFTITVNPVPDVQDPADQTVCNGALTASVSFTGTLSGTTYNWTNDLPGIGLPAAGTGDIAAFIPINAGTVAVTATITVTPTANGCSGPSQNFTITVQPTPDVANPGDQTVCNGGNTNDVNFTGGVAGTVYNWINDRPDIGLSASGTGSINAFTALNTGTTPVTALITVTPTANGCTGPEEHFTITVDPTPDVAVPASQTLCNGATTTSINFTGAVSGTTFTWTNDATGIGLAATGTGDIAAFVAVNTGTTPVVATITVTPTANGCSGLPQNFTITVQPTPNVAAPAEQTLCNGANTPTIVFGGGVGGTIYSWVNSDPSIGLAASGSGDIPAFTVINSGNAPVTATITITPSAGSCNGPVQVFTITVNPTPDVVALLDQTVCNGASTTAVNFTGSVSSTAFAWTNDLPAIGLPASGTGNIAAFIASNNTTVPMTANINVMPVANGCTGSLQTFTITVNPTPNVVDPADQMLCNGANTNAVSFSGATAGTIFNWTNDQPTIGLAASGSGDIPVFTVVNSGIAPVTATITVTPTANGCPGSAETFTITVNPTPEVDDPADQTFCNGVVTTPTVFVGAVNSTTFTWTNTEPGIGLAASGSGDLPAYTAVNAGALPVTATITVTPAANGCTGPDQTFTITVEPTPHVNDPLDQILCNGESTNTVVFNGDVTGSVFSWINDNPSIGLAASGTGDIGAFVVENTSSSTQVATITITPTGNGCDGPVQTFTITVHPTPVPTCPANIVQDVPLNQCNAVVNNLQATLDNTCGGASLIYELTGVTTGSGVDDASGTVFNIGETVVTYTVTDAAGAINSCSFSVLIEDAQAPVITCPGAVIQNTGLSDCAAEVNGIDPVATDNCASPTLSFVVQGATVGSGNSTASGLIFQLGMSTVTYTATDSSLNTTTCAFQVTIQDSVPPVLICPADLTIATDPGDCNAVALSIDPDYMDNCSVATLTYSTVGATTLSGNDSASGSIFAAGVSTITYTAVDASGNSTFCTFALTVVDQQLPSSTCPVDVIQAAAPGQCTAVVNDISATFTDNCGPVDITYNMTGATTGNGTGSASGTVFNAGITTLIYAGTDLSANTATCSIAITVMDDTAPTIACPADVSQTTDLGQCSAVISGIDAVGTDNCGTPSLTFTFTGATNSGGTGDASGSAFAKGTTVVTYTATDASMHTASCSFQVVITDGEPPVLTCPADVTVGTETTTCNAAVNDVDVTSTDNCPGQVVDYNIDGVTTGSGNNSVSGTTFAAGASTVTYTVTDAVGNTASCSFTVTVNDLTGPVIDCPVAPAVSCAIGNQPAYASAAEFIGAGGNLADNCGLNMASFALMNEASDNASCPETVTRTYSVIDLQGNISTCNQVLVFNDVTAPVLTLLGNDPEILCLQTPYNEAGATAIDDCGGDLSSTVSITGLVDITTPGTYVLTYTITDACGNQAQKTRTVTINNPPAVQINSVTCTPDMTMYSVELNTAAGSVTASAGTVADNGGGSYSISAIPAGQSISISVQDAAGCTLTQNVTAPNCACGAVSVPVSDGDKMICAGSAIPALSVSGYDSATETIDWFDAATGGNLLLAGSNQYTPASAGSYYAQTRVIATPACISSVRVAVQLIVHVTPLADAGTDATICENGTTTLSGSASAGNGQYSYAWNPATSLDDPASQLPVASPIVTTTYILIVTDGNGCSATDQVDVTVNPLPILNVIGTSCAADLLTFEVQLTSDAALVTATAGAVIDNGGGSFTVLGIPSNTGLTITAQSAAGCVKAMSINPVNCNCNVAAPTSAGDQEACAGATIPVLSVAVANTATETVDWYDAAIGGNLLQAGSLTFSPLSAGTYWAETRNTASGVCISSVRTGVTLTIHDLPVVSITDPGSACQNVAALPLEGTPAGGVFSGTGVTGASFDPALAQAGVHLITYEVTDTHGCSNVATQTVEVFNNPTLDAGADISACPPVNVQLNAVAGGAGGFIYQWNNSATLSEHTIANPVASPLSPETYGVTVTDVNGCSATDQISVDVNGSLSVDAGLDTAVCGGQTVQLQAQAGSNGDLSYFWEPAATLDNPTAQSPLANPGENQTYLVTVTNHTTGCSASDEITVTVRTVDVQAVSSSPICNGEDLTLDDLGNDGVTWMWNGPGGFGTTQKSPVLPSASVVAGEYTLLVTDANGCTATDTTSVSFASGAGTSFESKFLVGHMACIGDTVRFIEISDTLAAGVSPTSFSWSFGDGATSTERDPAHVYAVPGVYEVAVTVYNQTCPNYSVVKELDVVSCLQWNYGAERVHAEVRPSLTSGPFELRVWLQEKSNINIRIYNSVGRLIETRNAEADDFFLEPFELDEPGVYFVKLYTGLGAQVKEMKVVVARP